MRAGIIPLEHLSGFRWSSFRTFARTPAGHRHKALACEDWLSQLGGATDSAAGWETYQQHHEGLRKDERAQRNAGFDRMSRGWMMGSADFRRKLLSGLESQQEAQDWGGKDLKEMKNEKWAILLEQGRGVLKRESISMESNAKGADWKVALATLMKKTSRVTNRWLTEQLDMGPPDAVSRYCGECRWHGRPYAHQLFKLLTT